VKVGEFFDQLRDVLASRSKAVLSYVLITRTHTYINMCDYIYIYIFVFMCMLVLLVSLCLNRIM
jgi:hypothetical protein